MPALSDRIRTAGENLTQAGLDAIPSWLLTAGVTGWLVVGVALTLALVAWFFAYSASISIPLLLAIVIGMIAYPLCERMTDRGVPKSAAAALVLVLLFGIVGFVCWLVLTGVVSQWPAIVGQIQQGMANAVVELEALGIDATAITNAVDTARQTAASGGATSSPLTNGLLS
ncbi:MAG TPA: AI-2E family transporter, partial [Coriobacteriia bacterium]|nr:AI-2E family transporter [Coriobacteriia bacterium]